MRIAYVISAYRYPEQLSRLVARLASENATFVIHVDRKTARAEYEKMRRGVGDVGDVTFVPRHRSHWGGWGHVRATLKGLDHLVANDRAFDYAVLLTGQDYPLRSPATIERFLASSNGRSFMNHWRLPYEPWGERGGLDRIEDWHWITYRRLHVALPLRRALPLGLQPWGGGAYWCLARPLVEHVHRFTREHPEVVRFFRHVLVPDEIFFQTVLLNSEFAETVVNDNLRYIDWTREPAPAVLEASDVDRVVASGKLFARKFDITVDSTVLDLLDAHIDSGAEPVTG